MCGLTGIMLPPNADDATRVLAATVFDDLLLRTEHRGRHATGMAMLTSRGITTVKRAEHATAFVTRKAYKAALDDIAEGDASIVLGHTRYATHGAAQLDRNAHPFTMGKVTGAHNGIITNWRAIETKLRAAKRATVRDGLHVDSEAAFALLDATKKPEVALAQLKGYFALTWIRGGALYVARTDAPLTMVYVPTLRLLAWNSERQAVLAALDTAGIGAEDRVLYDPTPGKVYRYNAALFDATATNVAHIGEFAVATTPLGFNFAQPTAALGDENDWSTRWPRTSAYTPQVHVPIRVPERVRNVCITSDPLPIDNAPEQMLDPVLPDGYSREIWAQWPKAPH